MKSLVKLWAPAFCMLVVLLSVQTGYSQFTIPEKPDFQTSVYDYANLLSTQEKTQLEEKLIRYSDSTSTQIVVATILDLKGESIDVVSTNWAQKWGVGQAKEDNGVFILVSKNDRQISIRPGYGLEDKLIAATCGQIIDYVIVPEFKAGSYYKGLDKGADAIIEVVKGKYKGTRKQSQKDDDGSFLLLPFLIIFIIILIIAIKNRNNRGGGNSGGRGGLDLTDIILLSSLGRGSGGSFGGGSFGGGSGGGGFGGGFGGGGFSGGGASGGW
ncbi:TPM domain-containing protein [Flavobacterium sp. XGLA_31]|uniref:TPM domain-containing protein n=1 Tax=Flavobacterium sp. XGLA_31 TaxID=3447666 RepID=UPI003F358C7C